MSEEFIFEEEDVEDEHPGYVPLKHGPLMEQVTRIEPALVLLPPGGQLHPVPLYDVTVSAGAALTRVLGAL